MNQEALVFYGIVGAFVLVLLLKSVLIVTEATAVVIERLGKFNRIAGPGFGLIIPFIDRKAATINLRVQQLDVTVETKTKDNVFVNLQVSVQFKVGKEQVKEAYYSMDNPRNQISSYVFDDVRAEVPKLDLDDVFAKKEDIALAVQKNIHESMDDYGYSIIKALITDIDPDHKVKDAMNRINAAKRDREAALEEGEGKKIKIIKEAEAEAEAKRLSGEGIARQRLEIVRGFKESVEDFKKSLDSVTHEEIMQFVLMTQYFDTIKDIGANSKNSSILMPHSPGGMRDFQDQIIQGTFVGSKLKDNMDQNQ
ncbi:MAG: SPFH domain-containing protein [Crocinitomicaceae bacterium]|jgi:regulator of protease activity HflC (stomatin/prohibitin superfamily)|nr:SPFH domain-containing protein [Crocinitomicaceae bacterium]MDP4866421.1 SPFH domain-containing protein [Crocinitomicaceae bacterium]MDP5009870.1 SPFH domain-containing protein [Crocinitomicaceae bacterium]MDP5099180.1 SPFH domain-containing protein [Crocinitomicaceae bacterium]